MNLITALRSRIRTSKPLLPPAGLFHYERRSIGERSRIHLRIDPGPNKQGPTGILLVNANRILHLNHTATLMAYLALQETPLEQAIDAITYNFQVSVDQAKEDYAHFSDQLDQLIRPDGACPVHDLDLDVTLPFSARPSAPYRMDLAITYRCNNDCPHCYNARPRQFPEITLESWKQILDCLWEIGIPHVVFTGGEPTLYNHLPDLIAYAEGKGQITGLNTNGRRLSQPGYLAELIEAGLDHVQITLESHDPTIHDRMVARSGAWKQTTAGLRQALDSSLFVMTNTTLLRENIPYLGGTLDFLAELGVPTIGLNSLIYSGRGRSVGSGLPESDLPPLLDLARERTSARNQRLIWYTPTQYCNFDPVQLELGVKGCTAALYNMCVEPDGSVLPCQSFYHSLGNLLQDPWETIWNHDLSRWLRERQYVPDQCNHCTLLKECGGGCPLTLESSQPNAYPSAYKGPPL